MVVSFIIVALNAEETLGHIFEDLKKQSYDRQNIEIILVDSASADDTKKRMINFQAESGTDFRRICVLDNPKKTLPCGWNVALKEVRGDIILRVDAHTRIPENFIEMNVKNIENGEKICGGRVLSIVADDNQWQKMLLMTENSAFGGGAADFRRKNKRCYVSTLAFAAYSREVFQTVGGYDERLARTEDNEIHYRMKESGFQFLLDGEITSSRYARSTLSRMLRQKFLNGKWIGLTMAVQPKCFSLYHFVPLLFTLAVLLSPFIYLLSPWLFFIGVILYLAADLYMSIKCIKREEFSPYYLLLPILFFLLHLFYGLGTIIGLIKMPFWRNKSENKSCPQIETVKQILNK